MLTIDKIRTFDSVIEDASAREVAVMVLDEFAKLGAHREIMSIIFNRTENDKFREVIAHRDSLYEFLNNTSDKIKKASRHTMTHVSLIRLYNEVYDNLQFVNHNLNKYRAVNARYAEVASTLRDDQAKENGTFISYDEDTIGELVAIGAYESGSEMWHQVRQAGIGGSDVGKIMGVDKKYAADNYRNVRRTKLGLETDEDPNKDMSVMSAVGRGNAWEENLRQMYQDNHPDQKVAFCKTSWEGKGEFYYRHANFDGLILDDNGVPTGILEIKTGVHKSDWGNVEDGVFAVPAGYRKQALWYAMLGHLTHGVIVALLDDYDYREYAFDMSDPVIQAECKEILEATDNFWVQIQEDKQKMRDGMFLEKNIQKGFRKDLHGNAIDSLAKGYAPFAGMTKKEALKIIKGAFKNIESKSDSAKIQEIMTDLYKNVPAKFNKPFVGIDIETSSDNAKRGHIIELAIVNLETDGKIHTVHSELYGVPEKALVAGTGRVDVHHITPEMIADKPVFLESKDDQAKILDMLKNGVMVAHNANYEIGFLSAHLDGFAAAYRKGEIQVLDTRMLITNLMLESKDNSLNSFAEDNGVEYVDAHRAEKDTVMMMEALKNFRESI